MNTSKHGIIVMLLMTMKKGHTHVCKPAMDTILERIAKYQNIHVGRCWGFRCMHDLEEAGYIKRRRRWVRDPETGIRSKSSVWTFTWYGINYCISKGMEYARVLLAALVEWRKRHDGRFPGPKDIFPGEDWIGEPEALARLQKYIKDIGRWPAGGDAPAPTKS